MKTATDARLLAVTAIKKKLEGNSAVSIWLPDFRLRDLRFYRQHFKSVRREFGCYVRFSDRNE